MMSDTQTVTSDVPLFIDGEWQPAANGAQGDVVNPATGLVIYAHARAGERDLERAVAAADRAFQSWRQVPALERYKLLRATASLLRARVDQIATILTTEQGKPLGEARLEVNSAADVLDWCAEEGRRLYGRVIPSRATGIHQVVIPDPVGPVAAFSPWNFPIGQAVRKIGAALATGCTIIIKGPEETPASCAALVQAFADAGTPAGVLNLVFGVPSEISNYLIPHPAIRKVSFTGSTAVGKVLAEMAGRHMKRITMELGGHAPVIVAGDADVDRAVQVLAGSKFRNAGQICASPTRFLVQEDIYSDFVDMFVAASEKVQVGNGLSAETTMGPLAHERRIQAMETLVADAITHGANLRTGGRRIGNQGFFFAPTVLTDVPTDARMMNEEPFGPIVQINRFASLDLAIAEANRLPYGLAAYGFSRSAETTTRLANEIEAGMVSINHIGLALPETPFGGVKDSGYGSEGGSEILQSYISPKFVTMA